jgi:hypothetical protein
MARGFVYLAVVLDWFSRRVLSWRVSITMEAAFCVETLEDALARHGKPEIFNTDQGPAPSSPSIGFAATPAFSRKRRISNNGAACPPRQPAPEMLQQRVIGQKSFAIRAIPHEVEFELPALGFPIRIRPDRVKSIEDGMGRVLTCRREGVTTQPIVAPRADNAPGDPAVIQGRSVHLGIAQDRQVTMSTENVGWGPRDK